MAHLRGIPTTLRERFGVPVVFYDADVPMSLPEFGGMDTGFNFYHGADPGEYDLVLSNSEGGLDRLRELGARRAEHLFWGADPEFFAPQAVEKELDVFFYGYGDKFRREWMEAMVGEPSRALPDVDFALGGRDFQGDIGRARLIGDFPLNAFSARDLRGAGQPLHHAPPARDGACLVVEPSVRAGLRGRGDRGEPVRGHRALVRAGRELIVVERRRRGGRRVPRAARRSRRRPRSSAAVRASACSTSTRIATARASCSSCSTSRGRMSTELAELAAGGGVAAPR